MGIANRIGLENLEILDPSKDQLIKLVTFVPNKDTEAVRLAMFMAGAGQIGDYDQCSFNTEGTGSFRAGENTDPYVGNKGTLHFESETKVEVIVPKPIISKVVKALLDAHPYEEVAYDLYPLLNLNPRAGIGMVGRLKKPEDEKSFLERIKNIFKTDCIRHTDLLGKKIERVAFCGGSGASLIPKAIGAGADIFITSDVKYHQFFDANSKIIIADIGHFESDQFTVDIFYELLTKKLPNFAVLKTKVKTNPIKYFK